ncbi:hypothetical protein LCGC14_3159400, partial [marine sediment metagenome]
TGCDESPLCSDGLGRAKAPLGEVVANGKLVALSENSDFGCT